MRIKNAKIVKEMQKIAVLIPCYNEEKTIQKVVADFRAVLPEAENLRL